MSNLFEYSINIFKSKGEQNITVEDTLVFGSAEECDVQFRESDGVAPDKYFKIFVENDALFISPLTKRYTLTVNGETLEKKKKKLQANDEILFNAKAKNVKKFTVTAKRKSIDQDTQLDVETVEPTIPPIKRKKVEPVNGKNSSAESDKELKAELIVHKERIVALQKELKLKLGSKDLTIEDLKNVKNTMVNTQQNLLESNRKIQAELTRTESELSTVLGERDASKHREELADRKCEVLQA
jgi:hypothetical protein